MLVTDRQSTMSYYAHPQSSVPETTGRDIRDQPKSSNSSLHTLHISLPNVAEFVEQVTSALPRNVHLNKHLCQKEL